MTDNELLASINGHLAAIEFLFTVGLFVAGMLFGIAVVRIASLRSTI